MKVKFCNAVSLKSLEKEVNLFLGILNASDSVRVKDIQFRCHFSGFSAMIVYEEQEPV